MGVIDKLRRAGLRVAIISNHICAWFDYWFARYGLAELFEEPNLVVVSSRARSAKPDKEVFEYFCKESGLKPSDCVFVDDKQANVEAAEALGFQGIVFRHISKKGELKDTAEDLLEKLRACSVP